MTGLHYTLKTCLTFSRKLCTRGLCRYVYMCMDLCGCVCIHLSPIDLYVCVCLHAYMYTSVIYGLVCVCVCVCVCSCVYFSLVGTSSRCVDLCDTWLPCVSRCLASGMHPFVSSQLLCESVRLLGGKGVFWVTLVLRGQIDHDWIWTPPLCPPLSVILTAALSYRLSFLASH